MDNYKTPSPIVVGVIILVTLVMMYYLLGWILTPQNGFNIGLEPWVLHIPAHTTPKTLDRMFGAFLESLMISFFVAVTICSPLDKLLDWITDYLDRRKRCKNKRDGG